MLFTNVCIFSVYAVVYWIAISTGVSPFLSIYIGSGCNFSLFLFKYSTKDFSPPSKQNSAFLGVSSLLSSIVIFNPFVNFVFHILYHMQEI